MSENKNPEPGETLEVFVYENVGLAELTPGGVTTPTPPSMTRDEIIKKVLERKVELSSKYAPPHNKKSRLVVNDDIERVLKDAEIMHEMCLVGRADYTTAYAIAHPQIDDKDPLRFYVTSAGQIIINPTITNHTNQFLDRKEGCMTWPGEPMKTVLRYNKVTLSYQTLVYREVDGKKVMKLSPVVETGYSGKDANVVQHELQHLNGKCIYDENASATDCLDTSFINTI